VWLGAGCVIKGKYQSGSLIIQKRRYGFIFMGRKENQGQIREDSEQDLIMEEDV